MKLAGGFPCVESVVLHAVQAVANLRTEGTDIVLEHPLRRVGQALLISFHQFALADKFPATSGERGKAFGESNLRLSRLELGVQHHLVFLSYKIVRYKAR